MSPTSRVALLDVNVLVALFDPNHAHHDIAHDWFSDHRADGWATCPVTENGFVRVLSQLASGVGERPSALVARLEKFCASGHHEFWPDTVSLRDPKVFRSTALVGHKPLIDIYILGLARSRGGLLATFDRSIPIGAVVGATRATLAVISAARSEAD